MPSIIAGQQKLLISSNELDKGKVDQLAQQVLQLNEQIERHRGTNHFAGHPVAPDRGRAGGLAGKLQQQGPGAE